MIVNAVADFSTGNSTFTTGAAHITSVNVSSTTLTSGMTVLFDNTNQTLTNSGGGTINTTGTTTIVGGYTSASPSACLNGLLYEVLIFPYSMTAAQTTAVYLYLKNKWGL